ncbi:hypothetical protein V1506DRAFT_541924 [Lipomyces tetrasporus]
MGHPFSPRLSHRKEGNDLEDPGRIAYDMTVTDSWTNIRGEEIVNYVLVTPNGEALFTSHTGSYLSKRIIEVIEDVGPERLLRYVLTLHPMSRMPSSRSSPLNILTCSESDVHHISSILQSRISLALILSSAFFMKPLKCPNGPPITIAHSKT